MNKTLAAAALMQTRGVGRKTIARFISRVSPDGLATAVSADRTALIDRYGLPPAAAEELGRVVADIERLQSDFDRLGVAAVTSADDAYPRRLLDTLGHDAPPVLFLIGNLDIAGSPAVGFCGSRKASEKGLRVARDSAAMLASEGVVLVSGYASGVDLEVHQSALEAGGTTIFVLPEGILHFRRKRAVARFLSDENFLAVSEFPPRLTWNARNAMQRNRTIIGLSDAMVVIESGLTGGTYACGQETLKCGHPLFVADYAAPADSAEGNQYFLQRGATAFRGNREGVPNLERIREAVRHTGINRPHRRPEPSLFPDGN